MQKIGAIHESIKNLNERRHARIGQPQNARENLEIEGQYTHIENLVGDLPVLADMERLDLSCSPDIFFEVLCGETRQSALKQQSLKYKLETQTEDSLERELKTLKVDYIANQAEIFNKERELTAHIENKLREDLQAIRKFETLNSEKITPYFLGLAKCSQIEASLDDIVNNEGEVFENCETREQFIRKSFEELYKKPNENVLENNCISEFLGNAAANPVVLEAKLNENEKNILEQPLRIEELDQSINNAKLKSAPGADGFSNEFIKKFWDIFRVPLFNLANSNYNDNNLHESFRTANIKLIPKKGDLRLLKNWRPISLLNCFYKVISRAITARLKKVMDKLTPTSQKGYSSTRRCQEVLMGLIEGIHECKTQNKRGAIISLDMRKAFDTLSHRYMEHCLDFFNFGPNFKKWLILLSTNRKACIILGTGRLSKIFKLKRGNAQGDIISPFLFLLGYQILLFKLQFDLQIVGILDRPTFSTDCRPLPPEVRTTPPKVLAMADDANCLVSLELDTLLRINNILTEFGILSGLECNIEKTALIPIGPVGEISQEIKNIGFEIKTSAIILGMKIHNNIIGFEDSAISIINSRVGQIFEMSSLMHFMLRGGV